MGRRPDSPEARAAAERFLADGAGRVVIKAQVLVGGRGKAGGVKLAGSPQEAEDIAARILGMDIKGSPSARSWSGPPRSSSRSSTWARSSTAPAGGSW